VPKLPVANASDVVRAFERLEERMARQAGSHIIMTKPGARVTLSIPNHRPVARGTLRVLIRSAEITADQFIAALT